MKILNVMWAGGSPYLSIHKVHQHVLSHAGADARISHWLLLGGELCHSDENTRAWHMPQRALKGKNLWRLLRPWLRLRLRKALKEAGAQVILLDGIGVARLVLPVLKHMPEVRAKVLFHGMTRLTPSDVSLLSRLPAEQVCVAAVSDTLARALQRGIGRPVQALRMAFDPLAFTASLLGREQARHVLALPATEGVLFGAVGRLVESKGFDMLIEAFASAVAQQPGIQLAIVGDGPLRASLQARIDLLGLTATVHLCGHHDDLERLYRAFDWLMVPSRAEGLGLVVQEAVIADVPVVCTDLPVFREQLQGSARYLPVDDTQAWAQEMARCDAARALVVAGQQRQALAPEVAWQAFCDGAHSLLRG